MLASTREILTPANAAEAASVLAEASREGRSVVAAGAGTLLRRTAATVEPDIVLSTLRMNDIAEYEPADLTIGVGAGCTLAQLQEIVAKNNQCIALDPPGAPEMTIGAICARGDAGPLRYSRGTPRDHVVGIDIVSGDGRVLHFGGRVVKNVAGYDVTRLVVGSHGSLGVIARVHLRLFPLPPVDRTLVFTAARVDALSALAAAVHELRLDVAALELLAPALSAAVVHTDAWCLLVRLRGTAETVDDVARRVSAVAGADVQLTVRDAQHDVWDALRAEETDADMCVRLASRPSNLADLIDAAVQLCARAGWEGRIAAHAGNGIVRVLAQHAMESPRTAGDIGYGGGRRAAPPSPTPTPVPAPAPAFLLDELARTRSALTPARGTLIVSASPFHLSPRDAWGDIDARVLQLMRGLKQQLDPAGIMARGSFVV